MRNLLLNKEIESYKEIRVFQHFLKLSSGRMMNLEKCNASLILIFLVPNFFYRIIIKKGERLKRYLIKLIFDNR
jgi:hypothetical protein